MDDSPIFDDIRRTWDGVTSHGRQDIDGVRRVWQQLTHHSAASPTAAVAPGKAAPAMSTLPEFVDRLRADIEADKARVETYGEEHLPMLAALAQSMATNPLVAVALNVVHLEPSFLTTLASVITEADNKLGAAKQAAADAQAAQDAALAAAQPPAEEVPAA